MWSAKQSRKRLNFPPSHIQMSFQVLFVCKQSSFDLLSLDSKRKTFCSLENCANMSEFIKISFIECTDMLLIFICRSVFHYTSRDINCCIVTTLNFHPINDRKTFSFQLSKEKNFVEKYALESFLSYASAEEIGKSWKKVFREFLSRKIKTLSIFVAVNSCRIIPPSNCAYVLVKTFPLKQHLPSRIKDSKFSTWKNLSLQWVKKSEKLFWEKRNLEAKISFFRWACQNFLLKRKMSYSSFVKSRKTFHDRYQLMKFLLKNKFLLMLLKLMKMLFFHKRK